MKDIDAMLDNGVADRFKVEQIKEKFAGLRVYWTLGKEETLVVDIRSLSASHRIEDIPAQPTPLFDKIRARVGQAEQEASTTCQECGAGNATADGRGWLTTRCLACRVRNDQAAGDL